MGAYAVSVPIAASLFSDTDYGTAFGTFYACLERLSSGRGPGVPETNVYETLWLALLHCGDQDG